jgi:hypothetical protein
MKSLLKRGIWSLQQRLVSWLRPLVHKLDDRIIRLVAEAVRPVVVDELERRVRPSLDATQAVVRDSSERTEEIVAYLRRSAQENTLLLDSLVRELVRVQMQLDAIERPEPEEAGEGLMIG